MRRFGSALERMARTQRVMTPGAAGGRTPVVSPEPRPLPKPETLTGGYRPLEPFGSLGEADFLGGPSLGADGDTNTFHGIYTSPAAAAAVTGPVIEMGLLDYGPGGRTSGMAWLPEASASDNYGMLNVNDDGSANFEIYADIGDPKYSYFDLGLNPETAFLYLGLDTPDTNSPNIALLLDTTGDVSHAEVKLGSRAILSLRSEVDEVADTQAVWIDIEQSTMTVPNAPTAFSRLFTRVNGSGKTELCVIFDSGVAKVLEVET